MYAKPKQVADFHSKVLWFRDKVKDPWSLIYATVAGTMKPMDSVAKRNSNWGVCVWGGQHRDT